MTLTYDSSRASAALSRADRAGDRYVMWLGFVLLGYTLFSRGFAYLGLPPLFIGEIMILFGVATAVRTGRLGPILGQPSAWILATLIGLAVLRMIPYLGVYGMDAPRDFMQIGYGVYAFIIGALLVARPERLGQLVELYAKYVIVVLSLIWLVYLAYKTNPDGVPTLPWAGHVSVFEAKGGDIMVQLTGITVFVVAGFRKRTPLLIAALVFNIGIVIVSNRGGMVAFFLGCALAWMLRPPTARVGRLAYAFAFLLVLGLIIGPTTAKINGGGRSISVEQIVTNVKSVFGQGGDHLDGTKQWRLDWWEKIYNYTVRGEHFWTGKGFGINLAKEDGFDVVKELRSPHNGHMTILARMGVPGAALWVILQLTWSWGIFREWLRARQAGRNRWMGFFALLSAYFIAFHINAAFDVYFEGPMGGIWFWTVFGTGLAAVWIHKHAPHVLADTPDDIDPKALAAGTPSWTWGADDPQPPEHGWARPPSTRPARPQLLPTPRW